MDDIREYEIEVNGQYQRYQYGSHELTDDELLVHLKPIGPSLPLIKTEVPRSVLETWQIDPLDTSSKKVDRVLDALQAAYLNVPIRFTGQISEGTAFVVLITNEDAPNVQSQSLSLRAESSITNFVRTTLYGQLREDRAVRFWILRILEATQRADYDASIDLSDLRKWLYLPEAMAKRTLDYLEYHQCIRLDRWLEDWKVQLAPSGLDELDRLKRENKASDVSETSHRELMEALAHINPTLRSGYEQIVTDLDSSSRDNWRGTINEMRELLRDVLTILAPDEKVLEDQGLKLDKDTKTPTRRQRAQYVLRQRSAGSKKLDVIKHVEGLDDRLSALISDGYTRLNDGSHNEYGRAEAKRCFYYLNAFLADLIDL